MLEDGMNFIKHNNRMMWKKTPTSRIEMPEYAERSCLEALVNALVHRSYLELGSEVHIDIFDDRLEIISPGGMVSGKNIQDLDLSKSIISKRRNPVLADVFARLGYMERQGSGIKKIIENYESEVNYSEDLRPEFSSDSSQFSVILKNLNYGKSLEKVAIDVAIDKLHVTAPTKEKIRLIFSQIGPDGTFGRKEITGILGISQTSAGNLINKLKKAGIVEAVSGLGKGKYKFRT